jgi:hypothetical protein
MIITVISDRRTEGRVLISDNNADKANDVTTMLIRLMM